tara:strand:- start:1202 stop:1435 length:234 start_codon:yes stop_codon:yes gene_type:complete
MTIEEMITDFTEQQSKVRAEVAELKEALKAREDQLLRLGGAIEGLRLATQNEDGTGPGPAGTNAPPVAIPPKDVKTK